MSAQLKNVLYVPQDNREYRFQTMAPAHLDQVVAIENAIYQYPWTLRNFSDSIAVGYSAEMLMNYNADSQRYADLVGYFVMMRAVDEVHLLNISVTASKQKKGYGRLLLERAVSLARQQQTTSMILEVRVSNRRAKEIYLHYGFEPIGVRKGYYPYSDIDRSLREDAIVMRLNLDSAPT